MRKTRRGVTLVAGRWAILLAGMWAIVAACSPASDVDRGEGSSQAGMAVSFCEDFFDAVCQQLWRCGCNERALEICEYQLESCSEEGFFLSLKEGIAKGWLRYDPAAADAVLARMTDAPEACDDQFVVLGFDSVSGHTFGGVFRGTLDAGSECEPDRKAEPGVSYCREGLLCLLASDQVHRCAPIAAPGEACPVVPEDPGSSCLERRPVDPDGTFTSAQSDLACVPDTAGSETGTCQRGAADGTHCAHHSQCDSGFCQVTEGEEVQSTCARRAANGRTCFEPNACDSGRCDFSMDPPTCAEPSPKGGDCLIAEDCASGHCVWAEDESFGTCEEAPTPLAPGAECGAQDACAGGLCVDNVCLQPICTTYNR